MRSKAKIFGAALDYLDDPERLRLKLSYVRALQEGRVDPSLPQDPYDVIAPVIVKLSGGSASLYGKVIVPGWLLPRPPVEDLDKITPENYREFMDTGGPAKIADQCAKTAEKILPHVPAMIAVDHSLCAGPIRALSRHYGAESLCVVVLDSHFDAVPAEARAEDQEVSWTSDELCGAFLATLVRDGFVLPQNLFVIGVSDFPNQAAQDTRFGREYLAWLEKGVHIYPKDMVRDLDFFIALEKDLTATDASVLYISLDADVGACSCMNAVRFMDTVGLDEKIIIDAARVLGGLVDQGRFTLGGIDVCEVDVHFLGLNSNDGLKDRTVEICAGFVSTLLGRK